jgi:hypothetical protein
MSKKPRNPQKIPREKPIPYLRSPSLCPRGLNHMHMLRKSGTLKSKRVMLCAWLLLNGKLLGSLGKKLGPQITKCHIGNHQRDLNKRIPNPRSPSPCQRSLNHPYMLRKPRALKSKEAMLCPWPLLSGKPLGSL